MDKRIIKKVGKIADKIIALESKYQKYSQQDFINLTNQFIKQVTSKQKSLDDILIQAYGACREVAFRIQKLKAFRVQLIGAIILHQGDVAEMRTGEGKTLVALFPAYLNALNKKGVHVVTVNEYLSERDYTLNKQVLNYMGLSAGLNLRAKNTTQKQEAYRADVTYTTNSELGFDYLRDNMVKDIKQKVQRQLTYAIVDEADSIIIDEARTPLIISGGKLHNTKFYILVDKFAKTLKVKDYILDLESKNVSLTSSGVKKAEQAFQLESLFSARNTWLYHLILNALKANFSFKNGVEYVVSKNKIVLVDQFTGRLMPGRSYSDGLQQAIQAKELIEIEDETITMATITYQNFFRLYAKLCGMTGTAKTEEEEFIKIYNMRVVAIPTNKPIIRKDEADYMFHNRDAKLKSLMKEIIKINAKGQPILIGTTSVDSSEIVARYLEKNNLKFEMLNAKNHEKEAQIIKKAGQFGAITLATNMAGRGTDIKLGKGIAKLGGLVVFGIERNEARRIDNQLRGRSGRQGDPGFSRFYIAADDDLMIRFGGNRLANILSGLKDKHLQSKMLSWRISGAQKKVEGMNFDVRKNILDYDNVIAQHREVIYAERDAILKSTNLDGIVKKLQNSVALDLIRIFTVKKGIHDFYIDYSKLQKAIESKIIAPNQIDFDSLKDLEQEEIIKLLSKQMQEFYLQNNKDIPPEIRLQVEKQIIINSIDRYWTSHIDLVTKLRSGIHLRSYSQTNPLHEYIKESAKLFQEMKTAIAHNVIILLATTKVNLNTFDPKNDSEKEQIEFRQVG